MKIDKFTEQQRELFDQFESGEERKKTLRALGKDERLSFSISFDTILLAVILLVMVAVLIYSTGVEMGHQHHGRVPLSPPKEAEPQRVAPLASAPTAPTSAPAPKPAKPLTPSLKAEGVYTIQVLSFRQTAPAERTREGLQKKGYPAFLATGPRGAAVCVGSFKRASEAQSLLKELQKLYPDCFVRKK